MKWLFEGYILVLSLTPRVVLLWLSIFVVLVAIGVLFDTKM